MAKKSSLDALMGMGYSQESIKKAYDAIQNGASAKEAVALLEKEPEVTGGFQDSRGDVYKETADGSHQIDRIDNSKTRTGYYNDIAGRYVTSDEEIAASSNLGPATEVYYNDIAGQWLPVPQQPKAVRRQPKPQVNVPTVYSPYNTNAPVVDARVGAGANMGTTLNPYANVPHANVPQDKESGGFVKDWIADPLTAAGNYGIEYMKDKNPFKKKK